MPEPAPVPPIAFRFAAPTPLRWVDVDSEGVVNNAVYLSLMEQARYLYFGQLGLLRQGNIPFVLAESRASYIRPGRLGMDVVTEARVTRLGRSSFDMAFACSAGPEVLVRAQKVLVWVGADLRPLPIDPLARQRIAAFEGIAEGSTG